MFQFVFDWIAKVQLTQILPFLREYPTLPLCLHTKEGYTLPPRYYLKVLNFHFTQKVTACFETPFQNAFGGSLNTTVRPNGLFMCL